MRAGVQINERAHAGDPTGYVAVAYGQTAASQQLNSDSADYRREADHRWEWAALSRRHGRKTN